MKNQYKVERKPAGDEAAYYEVMLSPFNTLSEVQDYIDKYQQYYPVEDRNYKITKISK